ncbi:YcjX family protein, partial [Salmonella enterica subsp. enterica serovar Kentucky]|nr:YcjX family protein [Salmonella enterica subsp. enterica serovar Kentucky]
RIEVGRDDGVEVRHIVGAIANEGDISSRYIGNIKLFASHSTIGPQAFNDMRLALTQLMQSFHYGQRTLFRRLFSPVIDKLLFAA